jgi:hypothetical protein
MEVPVNNKTCYYADGLPDDMPPLSVAAQDCENCYGSGVIEKASDDDYLCCRCDACKGYGFFWVLVD